MGVNTRIRVAEQTGSTWSTGSERIISGMCDGFGLTGFDRIPMTGSGGLP